MKRQTCGNDNAENAQLCGGCGVSLSVPTVNESGTAANGNRISIRLDPQNAEFYQGRGIAYEAIGNNREAEQDFAKAKELGFGQ